MSIFSDKFDQLKKADKAVKSPKYLQEVMGIGRIAENGIFEVGKGIYSRTYRFLDINYVTAGAEEQMRILKQYCKTVNAIDIYFLITIFNRNKNMQDFREHVLFQEKGDGFNWLRGSYNQIIEKRIVDGRQGIEQEKLLTVCVERKSYEQAKAFFATFEATLKQNFGELGSCIEELNAEERLRVLFNFYRIGEEEQFSFDFRQALKKGGDPKNDISPGYMQFYPGYFETERKKCRALFIKKYPSSLSDTFLNEITSLPVHSITTICIVPVPKELANKVLQKKYLGIENDILKQQRVRNKNNDFSSDISHIKKVQKEKIVNLMDDVRENDQNLFYTGVNFLIMAEDKKELDSVTETIKNIGNGRMCQIETHYYQQREAMNTILPVGNRQISTMRTMLTRDIAALLPFNVQELNEKSGVCYGINQVSHNLCIGNRKKLANGNGMVFGVPGSGKSYFSKSEMLQVFLGTDDDIICIDPTLEYFDIAEALGNQAAIINLSTYTKNYINPLDINANYGGADAKGLQEAISVKSDFIISLMDLIAGGKFGLSAVEKSVVDRSVRNIIKDLGDALRKIGMLIVQDNVWEKVSRNRFSGSGRSTWYYIDEFHLLLAEEQTANYSLEFWKRFRKWGGVPTGITQNVKDFLGAKGKESIFDNSEFIYLLNQAPGDKEILSKKLNISEQQLSFITNSEQGAGLLKFSNTIIPFRDRFPKETKLYKLMTTKPNEQD